MHKSGWIVVICGLCGAAGGCSDDKDDEPISCSTAEDCGADQVCRPSNKRCAPDCEQPGTSCVAPSQCTRDENDKATCTIETAPTCVGIGDQEVPLQTTDDTEASGTLHWALQGGCIATSYEASLKGLADDFRAAVSAFNSIECSQLCLDPPVERDDPPKIYLGERRIHLRAGTSRATPLVEPELLVEITIGRSESGVILGGTIWANEAAETTATLADFSFAVGNVIGLGTTTSVDSVMIPLYNKQEPSLPTSEDEIAVCALYGDPPRCEE